MVSGNEIKKILNLNAGNGFRVKKIGRNFMVFNDGGVCMATVRKVIQNSGMSGLWTTNYFFCFTGKINGCNGINIQELKG